LLAEGGGGQTLDRCRCRTRAQQKKKSVWKKVLSGH